MLKIRGLTKTFALREGEVRALDGVDFDVARGEFFVLLGPSGCGKTTMLRSIAGLERPDGGTIAIDGETVVAAGERRPIAMVFQSYAVWPHMDVREADEGGGGGWSIADETVSGSSGRARRAFVRISFRACSGVDGHPPLSPYAIHASRNVA